MKATDDDDDDDDGIGNAQHVRGKKRKREKEEERKTAFGERGKSYLLGKSSFLIIFISLRLLRF